MQPGDLIGTMNHAEESVELWLDLLVRLVKRLQEGWVMGQKEAAQSGLFIHHQFDETVCVEDNDVRTIDCGRALLNAFEAITECESQDSKCCNR